MVQVEPAHVLILVIKVLESRMFIQPSMVSGDDSCLPK